MAQTKFEPVGLGDRVKDPISGFTGIVICQKTWLNGCIRIGVQPEKLHESKPVEERHFDQGSLVLVKRGVHQPLTLTVTEVPAETRRSNGGPAREAASFRRR